MKEAWSPVRYCQHTSLIKYLHSGPCIYRWSFFSWINARQANLSDTREWILPSDAHRRAWPTDTFHPVSSLPCSAMCVSQTRCQSHGPHPSRFSPPIHFSFSTKDHGSPAAISKQATRLDHRNTFGPMLCLACQPSSIGMRKVSEKLLNDQRAVGPASFFSLLFCILCFICPLVRSSLFVQLAKGTTSLPRRGSQFLFFPLSKRRANTKTPQQLGVKKSLGYVGNKGSE